MPALYTITTRASGTILTAAIYNADHQNHVNNGDCTQLGGYSANSTQMKVQTYPGDVGSESLALSIGDELARIRYTIAVMRGTTTWYQGLPTGGGGAGTSYLPLTGGTLSGGLIIAPASGAGLTINGAVSQITINKPAGANANNLIGQTATSPRWNVQLGNSTSESGSNAGSDFTVNRYSDAGAFIDVPLTITRSTGATTLSGNLSVGIGTAGVGVNLNINKGTGAANNLIVGLRNSVARWGVNLGDSTSEPGTGNTGSDFDIYRYTDAGTIIDSPLTIQRSTGTITTTQQLRAGQSTSGTTAGIFCGGAGIAYNAYGTHAIAFNWTTALQAIVDNILQGNVTITSDYRIKREVQPLPSMWDRVKALKPISYKHKDFTPPAALPKEDGSQPDPMIRADDQERWGFIAHELQETLIEDAATGVKDQEDCIQSPNLMTVVATLTKALQEAMARIEKLEAKA